MGEIAAARQHLPIYWQRLRPHTGLAVRSIHYDATAGCRTERYDKPTLVVVGHGMVGYHFLEDCVNRNLHQQYQIVVFGEERYAAYDRVHLSEYFGGRSAESLSLVEGDFFARHGIELRLSQQIIAIDRDAHVVRTASGHEIHWDNWCWRPAHIRLPPVPGNTLPGCFVYRTLDDLDNIAAHAKGS